MSLTLPPAHPKQYEFITALQRIPGLRFVVGACGTKFGKTYGSTIAIVREAWNNPGTLNWWVAPTYKQSHMAYDLCKRLLPEGTFRDNATELRIVLIKPDGTEHSVIEFKSGDNPDSLRGFGVHFFVMDEAARQPYESFVSIITTVTQTKGKGFIISTPKGRGWFYDVYQRGEKNFPDGSPKFEDGEKDPFPEWWSVRMPTWANPHVDTKAVDQMRSNLPEDVFHQEVSAEFLLDSAGVFKGIKDCIKGTLQPRLQGHRYVMGVDLARLRDFSVLTVMDQENRHVVAFERFNQIAWEVQYHRILSLSKKYGASVIMDSTGLGDPIVETIQRAGLKVVPYKIGGAAAKQQLIDKLRVNIENGRISFPNIPILRRELENYEYKVTDTMIIKFSAPSGQHDDTVISLALANWGADVAPFVYHFSNIRGI